MGFQLANVSGRAALVLGEEYFDVATASDGSIPADPMAAIAHEDALKTLATRLSSLSPTGRIAEATLLPPVPRPQKSFGVGLNYLSHAQESSMELPKRPMVFTKFPSCIVGPHADVELRGDSVDYEGELVVVIGEGGRDIPMEHAWKHIVGVTVGQDISDRKVQMSAKPPHFDLGKSFDTFGPIGPVLVSTDSFTDPDDLHITTFVNDEKRQDAHTSQLIFNVPYLVSYLSGITTLVTGDVIFTGTPDGVGMTQGKLLKDGDVITTTIDGIGTLRNRCVRISDFKGALSTGAENVA